MSILIRTHPRSRMCLYLNICNEKRRHNFVINWKYCPLQLSWYSNGGWKEITEVYNCMRREGCWKGAIFVMRHFGALKFSDNLVAPNWSWWEFLENLLLGNSGHGCDYVVSVLINPTFSKNSATSYKNWQLNFVVNLPWRSG